MNIYEKMLAIATEISTVQKDLEVGTGKSSYRAVGEASVLRAVKPLEKKYGIYSYPVHRAIIESGTIENESIDYNTKEKIVKRNFYDKIETTYRFVNIEKPDEYIDIISYGIGVDSQDKSVGKGITYCDKYSLMKAYKLVTGDDPDQEPSEPLKKADIKKTLDKALLEQCDKLNITLDKIAIVYEKDKSQITNEDLEKAIKQQQEAIKLKKEQKEQKKVE